MQRNKICVSLKTKGILFLQSASEQKTEMEKIKHRIAEEAAKIEERRRKIEDELKEVQV